MVFSRNYFEKRNFLRSAEILSEKRLSQSSAEILAEKRNLVIGEEKPPTVADFSPTLYISLLYIR